MSNWTGCGSHRDYPTIEFRVTADDQHPRRTVLFDTGSDATYMADFMFPESLRREISLDELWDLQYVGSPTRGVPTRLQTKTVSVPVEISDGDNKATGKATVTFVPRWDESVFARCGAGALCDPGREHCDTRVGLVSTGLLAELAVEVGVDGVRRAVTIRRESPARRVARANRT